ncbi:MAG: type IX secretion system sortase PorU [bacterium]
MIRTALFLLLLAPVTGISENLQTDQSVLATGNWYKISVQQTGIHKVTYEDLVQLGMHPSAIVPGNIRLYGNGGGMLPEANSEPRIDDLRENPILVFDGADGMFDPGDYFIFYGEAPDAWKYNDQDHIFTHQKNLYSDDTYYFITTDLGPGKRVLPVFYPDTNANYTSTRFTDYAYHDLDQRNLIRSGKIWVGEEFNAQQNQYEFPFYFPNAIANSACRINTFVVARAPSVSTMYIYLKDTLIDKFNIDYTDLQSISVFARQKLRGSLAMLRQNAADIKLLYSLPTPGSQAWLNYLELNVLRHLIWVGPQLSFRDPNNVGTDKLTRFLLQNSSSDVVVWDVTDPGGIASVQGSWVAPDSTFQFIMPTPVLREFISFDGSEYNPVTPVGPVPNQNLHGDQPTTLIIVSHPDFLNQAEELAVFHRATTGITVMVAETEKIFNEFASGRHDLTAIRDYIRMLYQRAEAGNKPKYILLFGDGSYDYKNRIPNNTNFVPTFESEESFKFIATYVTDDYYGIMGEDQGQGSSGNLDLGMGRFPVSTQEQAAAVVEKIFRYVQKNDTVQSSWRNVMTFIADDEDSNLHLRQAEELCDIVGSKYPVFNVNKIYLDAYQLVKTPSGPRYPAVNQAINNAVANGSLILNYTGHGGEDGWTGEKVLTIPDIESWANSDKLPVFITATCEFSRFDNPERFSAGEMVIVKPKAGAIALYTTTRLALATSNFKLDTSFFRNLMNKDEHGEYLKMGDLLRISKNNNNNSNNIRNFVLLGDPAQVIAYPEFNVVTTEINGKAVDLIPDTLLGLSVVQVRGEVRDATGNKATDFNGTLFAKVYDKQVTYRTLANQPKSFKEYFQMQNVLLSDGPATIGHGDFSFSFVVPEEISPPFGFGKISYYARSEASDGNGYDDNVVIGGKDPTINPVNPGPDIAIYLDTRSFKSGDRVGINPVLIVDLTDPDGINYVGLGLGHEILATLDDDHAHSWVLNPYYMPTMNQYQSGTVIFPLSGLTIGRHTLTVKAWDMYNNPSEETVIIYVFEHPSILFSDVYTFPNPLIEGTTFTFRPDPGSGDINVQIAVYNVQGIQVRLLDVSVTEYAGQPVQVYWDGNDENGRKLSSGIYPFTLKFGGENGSYAQTYGKVIVLR